MKIEKKSTKILFLTLIWYCNHDNNLKMPKTHIKHCKRPQFNKIYHFESFYYGSRIKKNMVSGGKNHILKL